MPHGSNKTPAGALDNQKCTLSKLTYSKILLNENFTIPFHISCNRKVWRKKMKVTKVKLQEFSTNKNNPF